MRIYFCAPWRVAKRPCPSDDSVATRGKLVEATSLNLCFRAFVLFCLFTVLAAISFKAEA